MTVLAYRNSTKQLYDFREEAYTVSAACTTEHNEEDKNVPHCNANSATVM